MLVLKMEDYSRYAKDELVELISCLDSPVRTFRDIAVKLCETISCENCPVELYDCDRRGHYEKVVLHEPCCTQLEKWILNEARLIDGKTRRL